MTEREDELERSPLGGGRNRESETADDEDVEGHGRGPLGGGKNRESETPDDEDVEGHGRGPLGGGKT